MTPACRKRGFASVDILASWADIVGPRYRERVRPDRLIWPRSPAKSDPDSPPEPATLVVHTDGATALLLTHECPQVIEKINTFYGWAAVGRIKILQRPVLVKAPQEKRVPRALTPEEAESLDQKLEGVENERLRTALRKLGANVIIRNAKADD